MAPKITSSSNRSKRKTTKTVTSGQYPQRQNRQKVSQAKVTNADNRPSTGNARVTGGQKALPPGRQGGALAKRPSGSPAQRERYVAVDVREVKPKQLPGKTTKALPPSNNPRVDAAQKKLQAASEGTRGRYRVRGPATSTVKALPPAKPTPKPARGMTAAAAIGAIAEPLVAAAGQNMGRALGEKVLKPIGRRMDDMMPGVNSRDEAQRRQRATPLRQSSAAERRQAVRLEQYNPPSPRKESSTGYQASNRQSEVRSGGSPRTASQQPTQAMPRPKQKPAGAPDQASTSGIGPVKDGQKYSNMKLSIKETVRELQEMQKRSRERQKQKSK